MTSNDVSPVQLVSLLLDFSWGWQGWVPPASLCVWGREVTVGCFCCSAHEGL